MLALAKYQWFNLMVLHKNNLRIPFKKKKKNLSALLHSKKLILDLRSVDSGF